MAELRIALGATADVVSGGELKQSLGELQTGLQGHIDRAMSAGNKRAVRRTITAGGNGNNSQVSFGNQTVYQIPCDKTPSVGRLWIVRSVAVFDMNNPLTAGLSGIVGALCIGDYASPVPSDIRGYTFVGVPAAGTFNSTAMRVDPNENVYVVVNSNTTDVLGFTIEVDEYPDASFQAQRI